MPRQLDKLIVNLEDLTTRIEYTLDDFQSPDEEVMQSLTDAIESLTTLNDELDETDSEE